MNELRMMKEGKRKDMLRVLKDNGHMTQAQIQQFVPDATRFDSKELCDQGIMEKVGTTVGLRKPVNVYAITPFGLITLEQQRKPKVDKRPRKGSTKWSVPKELRKRTTANDAPQAKPQASAPRTPPTITIPDNVKYTKHEPRYDFHPYQPPKHFMECVRNA